MDDLFNRFLTPGQSAEIESCYQHINDTENSNLRGMPPDPLTTSQLYSMPRFSPPDVLPCANVEAEKYRACPNPGKMACSSCRLVSYCSKVCISLHHPLFQLSRILLEMSIGALARSQIWYVFA
jgi:hypothetical protein